MLEKLRDISDGADNLEDLLLEIEDCITKSKEIVNTLDTELFNEPAAKIPAERDAHDHKENLIHIAYDYLFRAEKIIENGEV